MLTLSVLSLAAGVISVTSPCCLPLLPGYLSYISGVSTEESLGQRRRRVVGAATLFVIGFAVVFTALGVSASVLGDFLLGRLPAFWKISGAFVILMGLATLGILKIPFFYRERRFNMRRIRSGPAGAVPLGMAFAFGWTPCIGPILGGVLTAAATTQTLWKGSVLLLIYSLGMGIPFMLLALAYARAGRGFRLLNRYGRVIERAGGVLLVAMGVLLITGHWQRLFVPFIRWFGRLGWPPI